MNFYIDKEILLNHAADIEKTDILEVYQDFIDKPLSLDNLGDLTKDHNHVIAVVNTEGKIIPIRKGVLIPLEEAEEILAEAN